MVLVESSHDNALLEYGRSRFESSHGYVRLECRRFRFESSSSQATIMFSLYAEDIDSNLGLVKTRLYSPGMRKI
jgi:hypothetical protein